MFIFTFFVLLKLSTGDWTKLLSSGTYGTYDIGEDTFNSLFQSSTYHILKRLCDGCISTHEEIYYLRYTNLTTFEPYDYMASNWFSTDNVLGTDFNLYSTLNDSINDNTENAWEYCNYDDATVGFPRDCGLTAKTDCNWNSWEQTSSSTCRKSNVAFYLYNATYAPTLSPTLEPTYVTSEPTLLPSMEPTSDPTPQPTLYPTFNPTLSPTTEPSDRSNQPTMSTSEPTLNPTSEPTDSTPEPSSQSAQPTESTTDPTLEPTSKPTGSTPEPTSQSNQPTMVTPEPTLEPTSLTPEPSTQSNQPTLSFEPTSQPTEPTISHPSNEYTIVWQRGTYGNYLASQCLWNLLFQQSEYFIIKRDCADCVDTHKEIWYRRHKSPQKFEPYDYMTSYWYSENNEMCFDDFGLYSNLSDAINDRNEWRYCNYDVCGIGFPGNCGPNSYTAGQWNTNDFLRLNSGGQYNVQFSVYTGHGYSLDLSKLAGKAKTVRTKSKKNNIVTYWYDAKIIVSMQQFFKLHPSVSTLFTFLVGIAFSMIINHGYHSYTKTKKLVETDETTPLLNNGRYV